MTIFDALRRIFSTGLIVTDVKKGNIKVIDTQRTQAYVNRTGNSSFFNKLHKNQVYQSSLTQNYAINRVALYRDYDMMDADPLIASILDIYVFESLTKDEYGDILKITSQNHKVKQILDQLFYQRLNCEFNFNIWFRNFVKYGDFFLALRLDQKLGIVGCQPVSPYDIQRVEDDIKRPQQYYFKFLAGGNQVIQNYEIAHFRLLNDSNFLPYGRSTLEAGRRIWKNLSLMIDAMMIQRIMRAPERRVFKIDVGNIQPEMVPKYMEDVIAKMKKIPYKDPTTGQINLKYNIQNLLEDFFIPVVGNQDGSSIQTLSGMQNSFTDDIDFMKGYMLAAFKVPKAFLAFEQGIQSKATLSSLDIVLARFIQNLQSLFVNELYRVALIHLFMVGFRDLEHIDFTLELNNPSSVKKIQDLQLWQQKLNVAKQMQQTGHFSLNFIYDHIYDLTEKESKAMLKQIVSDRRYRAHLQKMAEDIQTPQEEYYEQQQGGEEQYYEQQPEGGVQEEYVKETQDMIPQQPQENPLENTFIGGTPLNVD